MGGLDNSEPQQFSIRWNEHPSSIVRTFKKLRDEADFIDVTLACDGSSFTAHKVVLSACSPYFRKLLKANPCQHPIVILNDVRSRDLEALMGFMYNGEINIGEDQIDEFVKTAQMLQISGLADVNNFQKFRVERSAGWPNQTNHELPNNQYYRSCSPPPLKRSRSSENMQPQQFSNSQPNSNTSQNADIGMGESLLSQALECNMSINNNNQIKANSESSIHQSTGDESNSSDTALSERENGPRSIADMIQPKTEPTEYSQEQLHYIEQNRNNIHALFNLQGLTGGLLPGTSSMHNTPDNSFVSRRHGMDLQRVRATDPRPCPKCGKIYRSAHTLRTHLEDKHTSCPGYRCVLCGTVAKSRNSLHSHMSRQHRGISTKDLPVLPMPAPFDPDLASHLLAKNGVKVSPAELRARASPNGATPIRARPLLDMRGHDDPEDLTMNNHPSRFCSVDIRPLSPSNESPHSNRSMGGNIFVDNYMKYLAATTGHPNNFPMAIEQAAKIAAKLTVEQRKLLMLGDQTMDDQNLEDSEAEEDYTDEEKEPEPIKAE